MENDLVKEKLEEHDKRLDKHDDKFDKLERNDAINKIRIDNLCKSLDNLTGTLKWLSGCNWLIGCLFYRAASKKVKKSNISDCSFLIQQYKNRKGGM